MSPDRARVLDHMSGDLTAAEWADRLECTAAQVRRYCGVRALDLGDEPAAELAPWAWGRHAAARIEVLSVLVRAKASHPREEIARRAGLPGRATRTAIRWMQQHGLVEREGHGPGALWRSLPCAPRIVAALRQIGLRDASCTDRAQAQEAMRDPDLPGPAHARAVLAALGGEASRREIEEASPRFATPSGWWQWLADAPGVRAVGTGRAAVWTLSDAEEAA